MTERLDLEDYDNEETITLKIPISIPYLTEDKEFVRVDGVFEHQGEVYRLVKQKISPDTVTVICVKDHTASRIHEAMLSYVKTFTDKPIGQSPTSKILVSLIKEYLPQTFFIGNIAGGWQTDLAKADFINCLIPSFTASIIHPPERS